jgi:TATA-binding protein-associated factor Taf7
MYDAHFVLSKIRNMSYIGASTMEVVLDASYERAFRSRIWEAGMKVVADFDPTVPRDPKASEEAKANAAKRCLERWQREAERAGNASIPAMKAFFGAISEELAPKVSKVSPTPSGPMNAPVEEEEEAADDEMEESAEEEEVEEEEAQEEEAQEEEAQEEEAQEEEDDGKDGKTSWADEMEEEEERMEVERVADLDVSL